ncbi:MAG: transposase [Anaerolineae bacterium]
MEKQIFVGVDLHKGGAVLALLRLSQNGGNPFLTAPEVIPVRNCQSEFLELASNIDRICPSPTGVSILFEGSSLGMPAPLVYFLQQQGYHLFQIPAEAAMEARKRLLGHEAKSDELDASALAYLLYLQQVFGLCLRITPVTSSMKGQAEVLRLLVSQRWQLIKMHTQIANRLRPLVAAVFPEGEQHYFKALLRILPKTPVPEDLVVAGKAGDLKMRGMPKSRKNRLLSLAATTVGLPGERFREVIRTFAELRQDIAEHCKHIERFLADELQDIPAYHLLLSFPGMGTVTAATLLGAIGDIQRWKGLAAFKKSMGVYGVVRQSGAASPVVLKGRGGNRAAKRTLYQLVVLSLSPYVPDNDFRDYYRKQIARGKPSRKAMFATMAKLAKILYFCLQKGVPYQYQGHAQPIKRGSDHSSTLTG